MKSHADKEPSCVIEITKVRGEAFIPTLQNVRGFMKATSIIWLYELGLPVLPGLIVRGWSDKVSLRIHEFCRRKRFTRLLLRIDKSEERWGKRRGGYIVAVRGIRRHVEALLQEGYIGILLEPASPYADSYTLAALVVPEKRKMIVEVVGPGFDASDILRSDLGPHERLEVTLPLTTYGFVPVRMSDVRHLYVTDSHAYRTSVMRRLAKIGAQLENPAYPDSVLESSELHLDRLISAAMRFLKKTGQSLLLNHMENYQPLPQSYLETFTGFVCQLIVGLSKYGISLKIISISASSVAPRGFVFWDFFPARKEERNALSLGT